MINLSYFAGYILDHNGLKAVLKQLSWEKRKRKIESQEGKEPFKCSHKKHAYLQFYASKGINFWKIHSIFQVMCNTGTMGWKLHWRSFPERKKKKNWEPRKNKNPSNFSQHAYKYIIYDSMHQDLLIFEKAILLFKFGAVLYLGEPQRLNFFLKDHLWFCSPLVS